ncbi:MAG TPA: GNAT family N-acetyltransferase [Burkholderiales bacterium]|nr:GNAT family N-acetyltransferase [Burkholderiales bacterium]
MPKHPIIEVCESLTEVAAAEWDRLAGPDPFLSHAFLSALEQTGCASGATGWAPVHLLLKSGSRLTGAMPLYVKSHSYGEYVFDWAWADAYYRHGLDYYPKLVSAVPFTPVTGARILAENEQDQDRLIEGALSLAQRLRVSSLHCLFPTPGEAQRLYAHGMLARTTVQFHWANRGYSSFEDFLSGFNHAKRKKVKQERRKVRDAGIEFRWLEGTEIRERDWAFFERCYRQTYREHHSSPYLNLEFFSRIGRELPQHLVLVVGVRGDKPVSSSLNVRSGERLCGRYWGALEHHPALHFETCYYQGIEYCIARGIESFEGGSRGEHKLARGLSPVETFSAHWLAHPQFADAIEKHLTRETRGVAHYVDELNERSPYKMQPADRRDR